MIFDGHLDLAMNAAAFNRDLTWPLARLRQYEAPLRNQDGRGTATVTLDEMHRGGVTHCTATLFTRAQPHAPAEKCFRRSDSDSASPALAHAQALAQWGYYQLLERQGHLQIVRQESDLGPTDPNTFAASPPLRCVLLIECADLIASPADVAWWRAHDVAAIGLTHIPPGRCGAGNDHDGPLTPLGLQVLAAMQESGMALDVSHLADTAMAQALDQFTGPVLASHSNCRSLTPGMRQITDAQIKTLAQRDGVIGIVLCASMLRRDLQKENYQRGQVTIEHVTQHIDHVCQLVGDAQHVGLGTDLDGGFGLDYVPQGLDTIADLPRLGAALAQRGYADADVARIMHGNWLAYWRRVFATSLKTAAKNTSLATDAPTPAPPAR